MTGVRKDMTEVAKDMTSRKKDMRVRGRGRMCKAMQRDKVNEMYHGGQGQESVGEGSGVGGR